MQEDTMEPKFVKKHQDKTTRLRISGRLLNRVSPHLCCPLNNRTSSVKSTLQRNITASIQTPGYQTVCH